MNNDYEFRYENGVPVALTGAFGEALPKEIPLSRMANINSIMSEAVETFIKESRRATTKLLKALPSDEAEKAYARAFLYFQVHLHQEETGDSVAFVEPGKISASWSGKEVEKPSETQRKEHQSLAEQYNAYSGGLREDDLNRAFLVLAAENYVLQRLEEVKSRNKLNVTPQMLWNHVKSELDFAPNEWMEMLVPILVQDGWVLFNHPKTGETNLLPYGKGIHSYDEDLGIEHPMWGRNHKIPWTLE